MAFWSSNKLLSEQSIHNLIQPFEDDEVEQSSYTLHIGNEVFVTKDHRNSDSRHVRTKLKLNQDFEIPAGQFAFLLTCETVKVPKNAIAFISMKAKIKHRGLINISGFHVDPGYDGKLLFSVYNAGPSSIRLNQGQPCFLIWYADLDSDDDRAKKQDGFKDFPVEVLDKISSDPIYSLQELTKGFRELDYKVSAKITEINSTKNDAESSITILKWCAGIFVAAILALFIAIPKFVLEQWNFFEKIPKYVQVLNDLDNLSQEKTERYDDQERLINQLIEDKALLNKIIERERQAQARNVTK